MIWDFQRKKSLVKFNSNASSYSWHTLLNDNPAQSQRQCSTSSLIDVRNYRPKLRKKWTLDKGPEYYSGSMGSQNSTDQILVQKVIDVISLETLVTRMIWSFFKKWGGTPFAFHAYATWYISFHDFLHVISEIYTSRYLPFTLLDP